MVSKKRGTIDMKSFFGINLGGGVCEICGTPLNAINSHKIEKNFICKNCFSKTSVYLNKQRATYISLVNHIRSRDRDLERINRFQPTEVYGEKEYIFISDEFFVVSDKANYKNKNADIFELSDIISCKKRIEAEKEEVKYKDSQGETRSFTPQFFAYKFNFYIDIRVKNTEYNTISIKLNDKVIDNDQETLIKNK